MENQDVYRGKTHSVCLWRITATHTFSDSTVCLSFVSLQHDLLTNMLGSGWARQNLKKTSLPFFLLYPIGLLSHQAAKVRFQLGEPLLQLCHSFTASNKKTIHFKGGLLPERAKQNQTFEKQICREITLWHAKRSKSTKARNHRYFIVIYPE